MSMTISEINAIEIKSIEFNDKTKNDSELQTFIKYVLEGCPNNNKKINEKVQIYYIYQFTLVDNL